MLKALGYLWPLLSVVLIGFTMVVTIYNPVPMVVNEDGVEVQAVGVPTRAELWIRALPLQTAFVLSMAGIRFGAKPLAESIKARASNGGNKG